MFEKLKIEPKSVLFSEEKIEQRLLKKQKISTYDKNNLLLRLINISDQKISDENIPSTRSITLKKEKSIGLPYIALMDLFSLSMCMLEI